MRIYLDTLGCRLNEAESTAWGRAFLAAGQQIVARPAQADTCILNSCAVTGEAGRKSRQRLRRLHRLNPQCRIVVTGCYATLAGDALATFPGVELVLDNRQKEHLVEEVLRRWGDQTQTVVLPTAIEPASHRTRAFVKVQDGCNNHCTYCIVRLLRGEERSRPLAEVIAEVNSLAAAGYREVVLTGVHLGAYGHDLGYGLYDLVTVLLAETVIPRLRLSSIEPWDLPEHFFDLWGLSGGRLLPHLHMPLQSGCDRTLRRMGRHTTRESFAALVAAARAVIPGLTVTTDLIVGFPGETETDFAVSLAFVEEMAFGHIHIFPYSPREGTPASILPGQVPGPVKRQRLKAAQQIMMASKTAHLTRFLGETWPVLWEERHREAPGWYCWRGLTDNYLRVQALLPAYVDLHNQVLPARLLTSDGNVITAEPLLSLTDDNAALPPARQKYSLYLSIAEQPLSRGTTPETAHG